MEGAAVLEAEGQTRNHAGTSNSYGFRLRRKRPRADSGIGRDCITVATEAASASSYPAPAGPHRRSPPLSGTGAGLPMWAASTLIKTFLSSFVRTRLFPESLETTPDMLLVGTRDVTTLSQRFRRYCRRSSARYGSLVKWTGFLEDEILRGIHSRSLGLVLPSDAKDSACLRCGAATYGSP